MRKGIFANRNEKAVGKEGKREEKIKRGAKSFFTLLRGGGFSSRLDPKVDDPETGRGKRKGVKGGRDLPPSGERSYSLSLEEKCSARGRRGMRRDAG